MQQKTIALLIIAILMSFGFLAGTFVNIIISQQNIPASHKAIVDNMKLTLVANDLQLTIKLVDSANAGYGKGCPLSMFTAYNTYGLSTWVWQRYGDSDFIMKIWGPGDDGITYDIALGRVSGGNVYRLTYKGVTKLNIPEITDWTSPMPGYYIFSLQLP